MKIGAITPFRLFCVEWLTHVSSAWIFGVLRALHAACANRARLLKAGAALRGHSRRGTATDASPTCAMQH